MRNSITPTRRSAMVWLAASGLHPSVRAEKSLMAESVPLVADLKSGDLLWPKPRGGIVLYDSGGAASDADEKNKWIHDKGKFLALIEKESKPSSEQMEMFKLLQDLEFREFQSLYLADIPPNRQDLYSSGENLYVGHVAIVDRRGNDVSVIEALLGRGVVRQSYSDWLASRMGQIVWHARLKDINKSSEEALVGIAFSQIGKPYDFWNFDLLDDSCFYCSKLIWNSVYRSLGISLDDNPTARRSFWYSPKQIMKSKYISFLKNPGSYAFD